MLLSVARVAVLIVVFIGTLILGSLIHIGNFATCRYLEFGTATVPGRSALHSDCLRAMEASAREQRLAAFDRSRHGEQVAAALSPRRSLCRFLVCPQWQAP